MGVVFQIIYDVKLETADRILNSKFKIGEFHYLPEIALNLQTKEEDAKDQHFEHSINLLSNDFHSAIEDDDIEHLLFETPPPGKHDAPRLLTLQGLISTKQNVTAELRRDLLESLINRKIKEKESSLSQDINRQIE